MAITGNRLAGTYEVDPVSRIEGHLGVKVTVNASGMISDAKAHGNLWRGFENFLLGRDVNDAITYTQRICGVCPVPHGTASMFAADAVLGYSKGHITFKWDGTYGVPDKAVLIRNLVLAAEFLMSSITHFYHLAAPSYVQGPKMAPWTPYFDDEYYASQLRSAGKGVGGGGQVPDTVDPALWDAVILSYVKALKIRRKTFEAGALFAGRMPMTSCFVAGGVSNDGAQDLTDRCTEFEALIEEVGLFIVNEYVPIALALGALYQDFDSQTMPLAAPASGAWTTTMKANNKGYGAGLGRFLSWGMLPNLDDTLTLPGGTRDVNGDIGEFKVENKADVYSKFLTSTSGVPTNLTEDIGFSRYEKYADDNAAYARSATRPYASTTASYPGDVTRTKPKRSVGYTYMKGPRWQGKPCEVGPLARLAVAGIYPVVGTTLTTIPGYVDIYVNDAGGLDTRVINETIVDGLTKDGLVGIVQAWVLGLKGGLSTMDRLRARAIESLVLVQAMLGDISKDDDGVLSFAGGGWVDQLAALSDGPGTTWRTKTLPVGTVQNWGATEAPRGALMHQAKITNGKIVAYQCIVPTTWNGSPKDAAGGYGAIEAAVIGAPFKANDDQKFEQADGTGSANTEGGVEVLRIAQSFDPCIACAVH